VRATLCCLLLTSACLKSRPAQLEEIESTPAVVERGAYLANAVFACIACHSDVDDTMFAAPPQAGSTPGAGGQCWDESVGFPGKLCAPDITGMTEWSDGEVMRAIREGIDRHGNGLFPMMPYRDYAALSDGDTKAIVAYLRSLPPAKKTVPEKELNFPVGIFIRLVPRPLEGPVAEPTEKGAYLAIACKRCHSPVDGRGRLLAGKEWSGGQVFKLRGGGEVASANLTGLKWTKDQFVARFRQYKEAAPATPQKNTVMPWLSFGHLTDEDLGAIYDHLRTLPAQGEPVTAWK
jgi:mono/diheme cytochrome c family protein